MPGPRRRVCQFRASHGQYIGFSGYHDRGCGGGVKARGRLVQEQNKRVLDQRKRERETPLLPSGQTSHELAAALGVGAYHQPHLVQEMVHASFLLLFGTRYVQVRSVLERLARCEERPMLVDLVKRYAMSVPGIAVYAVGLG